MTDNLFAAIPSPKGTDEPPAQQGGKQSLLAAVDSEGARSTGKNEQFSNLLNRPGLRIERIVSTGQCSPDGFWYDRPEGEWVVVLQGQATSRFEDTPEPLRLNPGDFIDIAPYRRHRVEWTDPEQPTVWLAIHYAAE